MDFFLYINLDFLNTTLKLLALNTEFFHHSLKFCTEKKIVLKQAWSWVLKKCVLGHLEEYKLKNEHELYIAYLISSTTLNIEYLLFSPTQKGSCNTPKCA